MKSLTISLFCVLCCFGLFETVSGFTLENESYVIENFKEKENSEFPEGPFSPEDLKHGAVILYLVGALYSFGVIGIVCGDYFLPSVDCICTGLNLSQDVAAATFMSFATTAPELFIILVATFVKNSDVGVGAVVGSGMFNILGVATIGGLAARSPIKLDWWPLYRDSLVYMFAPIALAFVLADGEVSAVEAGSLIAYYFIYFVIMCFNRRIRQSIKLCIRRIQNKVKSKTGDSQKPPVQTIPNISLTLHDGMISDHVPTDFANIQKTSKEEDEKNGDGSFKSYFMSYEDSISLRRVSASSRGSRRSNRERKKSDRSINSNVLVPDHQLNDNLQFVYPQPSEGSKEMIVQPDVRDETEEEMVESIFALPEGTIWNKLTWVILWPVTFVLHFSIPDCRSEKWRKFYPVTFLMCVFWIGISSYFGTWMVTVVGETIGIPESVMGLTFLALGGSMPEAISTFIMSRQGEGGLGFSNSLGGNTMDICLCLGVPWLIKCALEGTVKIQSEGLQYNTVALVMGIVILMTIVTKTKFYMNKQLGIVCCIFYLTFVVVSIMIEMDIIYINLES